MTEITSVYPLATGIIIVESEREKWLRYAYNDWMREYPGHIEILSDKEEKKMERKFREFMLEQERRFNESLNETRERVSNDVPEIPDEWFPKL